MDGGSGMKAGWQTKTLGEVIQLPYGKPLDPKDRNPNGLYPAYGANGVKDRTDKFYRDSPSIIVGRKGSAGEVTLTEDRFWPLDVTYFVEFDRRQYSLQFLYYLLVTLDLPSMAKGVKPGINRNEVYALPVMVPPLPEQQRIVTLLDEAFYGIATAKANAEKNLQNARAIFESHLQSVFTQRGGGWLEKSLGDAFKTATGTTPPKNNSDFYGDFMPLAKPPELCNSPFDTAPDGLSEAGAAVARTLPPNSILVSCIGNLGKIGMNTVPVAFNQQINAILPNEKQAIPEFMFFQALSPIFKEQLESLASGTTVPIVNKSKFNSVRIVLPALIDQKISVGKLEALRDETYRLKSIYQQKLTALNELKKSLLHRAFSGEL